MLGQLFGFSGGDVLVMCDTSCGLELESLLHIERKLTVWDDVAMTF